MAALEAAMVVELAEALAVVLEVVMEAGSAAEPVAGSALGLEVVKVAAPAVG